MENVDELKKILERERAERKAAESLYRQEISALKEQHQAFQGNIRGTRGEGTADHFMLNLLLTLINNLQCAVMVTGEKNEIIFTNKLFCGMFDLQLEPPELKGMPVTQLAAEQKHLFKDPGSFIAGMEGIISKRLVVLNDQLELNDGGLITLDHIPITIDNNIHGQLWIFRDISQSKGSEKQLEAQRVFYEKILDEIPADISVFDAEKRYLYLNHTEDGDEELRGWMIGKTDMDYYKLKNKPLTVAEHRYMLYESVIHERQEMEWEEELAGPDGGISYYLRKMYPAFNEDGSLQMMIGYGVNITQRIQMENALRESEERYRLLVEEAKDYGILMFDERCKVASWNEGARKITGYDAGEVMGKHLSFFYRQEDIEAGKPAKAIATVIQEGKFEEEGKMLRKDGTTFWAHMLMMPLYNLHNELIGFSAIARDLTEQKNAEEALRKSEEKYRSILENMNMGMLELDREGKLQYANQRFCEMSGYQMGELLDKTPGELNIYLDKAEAIRENARNQGGPDAYEIEIKDKKGESGWWLISTAPRYSDHNEYLGMIAIHLDITERKKLEVELRNEREKADASSHSKQLFLANMSHEIRTPMNAIIGMSRLVVQGELEIRQRSFMEAILLSANNLLTIIDDILDLSKIEAGKLNIHYTGFRPAGLLEQLINTMQYKAEEKGIVLAVKPHRDLSEILISDPARLNQILINLTGNAVKFTDKGRVDVEVDLLENRADAQVVCFKIRDTGIGIAKDRLPYVFDVFYQVNDLHSSKSQGTGLGLSITRQLVELLGGELFIESEKGEGTEIGFVLTLKKGTGEDLPVTSEPVTHHHALAGKRLLLAEDNEMNSMLALAILENWEVKADHAENGLEVIEKLKDNTYDLILMDVRMPGMNGLEATRYIRDTLQSAIPVIAMTADVIKVDLAQCEAAGMNDYIIKPFEEQELFSKICRQLKIDQGQTPFKQAAYRNPDKTITYNTVKLEEASKGNKDFVKRMLAIFVTQVPSIVEELQIAYTGKDFEKIRDVLHKAKPSIKNICPPALGELTESLEEQANQHQLDRMKAGLYQLREQLQVIAAAITENELK